MPTVPPLAITKLVHVNQVVGDLEAANAFYRDVFGAQIYAQNYDADQHRDMSLFVIGDTCIELYAPRDEQSLLGRWLARYGPGLHSFEWQVPDLEEAKAILERHGVRVPLHRPEAFLFTHPADCHGMLLEICPLEMRGDPRIEPGWSPAWWREEHPLGVTGLDAVGVAVRDLEAAVAFVSALTGAEAAYEEIREPANAAVVGFPVADHVLELVAPKGENGPVAEYLQHSGQRVRSVDLHVSDLERARAHLEACGLAVGEGDRPGSLCIDGPVNFGARWQFSDASIPGHPFHG